MNKIDDHELIEINRIIKNEMLKHSLLYLLNLREIKTTNNLEIK